MARVRPMLHLVDLDQPAPGYRRFISSWVWTHRDRVIVVDPGPTSTLPVLTGALRELGLGRVDLVLLTHIHLDHGGGTGTLLESHPEARVWVPPRGRRHVVNPSRLWAGSVKVLGDTARMYGEPLPVPITALLPDAELAALGIEAIEAPGHAPHHAVFVADDLLLAGEVFGTRVELADGATYLRPATPPRFFPEAAFASLERMAGLDPSLRVAFAHHGLSTDPTRWAALAREQLTRWLEWAREAHSAADPFAAFLDRVLSDDPLCGGARHAALEEDLRLREQAFLRNTWAGLDGARPSSGSGG